MTDKQKEAIMLLNSIKAMPNAKGEAIMTDEQYCMLLEFIIDHKTEVQYIPQPTIPYPSPQPLQPITEAVLANRYNHLIELLANL